MGPAKRLVLESRAQQPCKPFVHLLGKDRVCMHRQPNILPLAPDMVGQPDGHRRGTPGAPLAQALGRLHKGVEADQQPDASAMTGGNPRPAAGAATQGCPPPTQSTIPAFHLHGLRMMGLRAVGRDTLEVVDWLERHGTNDRRPLITDTPPLTLQQLVRGRC